MQSTAAQSTATPRQLASTAIERAWFRELSLQRQVRTSFSQSRIPAPVVARRKDWCQRLLRELD